MIYSCLCRKLTVYAIKKQEHLRFRLSNFLTILDLVYANIQMHKYSKKYFPKKKVILRKNFTIYLQKQI